MIMNHVDDVDIHYGMSCFSCLFWSFFLFCLQFCFSKKSENRPKKNELTDVKLFF